MALSSLLSLSRKNLPGVPSRDLNSDLPYSRPACYQLSHAAPWMSHAAPYWAMPHPYTAWKSNVRTQGRIEPAIFGSTRCRLSSKPLLHCILNEKITILYFESISYFLRKGKNRFISFIHFLKGYFPEGSFIWLTFCYSVWCGIPAISVPYLHSKLWVKRQIGELRAWIENENR